MNEDLVCGGYDSTPKEDLIELDQIDTFQAFKALVEKNHNLVDKILSEILEECNNQYKKWGEQNHPILDQVLLNREGGCNPQRMCEEYEIPTENRAKFMCEESFRKGQGTFMHILIEEISEAVSCLDNTETMRKELIQCGAVIVSMIDSLDRKNKK
jgi:hypothetical protein